MRFLERIGSAWAALRSKSAPPAGSYSYGWGGGSSWSDAFKFRRAPSPSELTDAYKSIVYACVNLNANAVARTPLRLYAITKGGQARPKCAVEGVSRKTYERLRHLDYATKSVAGAERVEEVTAHPLLDAVRKVNDDLDHTQLITYTAMSLDIVGAAYWWPSLGRLGLPEELWALPPHLVFPVFTSGTMVPDAYNFGGEIYPKDQLIRFRRLSAKNPYGQGYGPEQAAIEYARLEDTFVSLQDDLLSNGPRPSVIVSHKDPRGAFGPAERQRLEADMERRGRGGRSGGVFVVDGAATITPVSYSPTDLGAERVVVRRGADRELLRRPDLDAEDGGRQPCQRRSRPSPTRSQRGGTSLPSDCLHADAVDPFVRPSRSHGVRPPALGVRPGSRGRQGSGSGTAQDLYRSGRPDAQRSASRTGLRADCRGRHAADPGQPQAARGGRRHPERARWR